jgi:integrase
MLTDKEIRAAKPTARPFKLADGRGGPILAVLPNGRKAWRLRLFRDGKETMLALGDYPDVSLAAARDKAHSLKSATREGRNVAAERKGLKPAAGNRVRDVAAVWIEGKTGWTADHREQVSGQLDRLVFPTLGDRPVAAVTAAEALATLRSISSADLAARCRARLAAIFDTAVVLGLTAANPIRSLNGMLAAPKGRNFRAVTERDHLGDALVRIYSYSGHPSVRLALLFGVYTSLRPGAVRLAQFDWVDGDVLRVPGSAMKSGRDFACPLSPQAARIVAEARRATDGALMFPNRDGEPLSLEAMEKALTARCKVHASPHGLFRATFATACSEWLAPAIEPDVIEAQLDHKLFGGATRAAYVRNTWLDARREAVRRYGELCDRLEGEARLR